MRTVGIRACTRLKTTCCILVHPPVLLTGRALRDGQMAIYKKIDLWVRYSQWYYTDRNIGRGLNAIEGNTRTELKVQLRWRF